MGRHSAPDSAESDEQPVGIALDEAESSGRHAQAAPADQDQGLGLGLLDETPQPVAPAPATPPTPAAKPSDLALLRAHADVRARCLAALVVPVAAYFAVLAVIGRLTLATVLIWCVIPLVTAGVLFGLFLDAGHRKYRVSGSADRP